jgi:hypothetical protein
VNRYDGDVLAGNGPRPRAVAPELPATRDLVVEDAETGFCGAVVRCEKVPGGPTVTLEDRHGRLRAFPLGPGFLVDGSPVTLVRPSSANGENPLRRTASGSVAVAETRARVALESRIYVEGRHDAELVERVWGDDLRVEGVVVEYLGGIDDLAEVVRDFRPGAGRRLGVLVDHLVPGSKESRIAAAITSPHVLVVGHPYVDVWQAVRPAAVGIAAWPEVPRGQPWKEGVCRDLGWPIDTATAWRRILACVDSYADLEPSLLGRVEEVIDFVTVPGR